MCEDLEVDILHPRPSAIAAAMYALRDLDVDAIVLHGPAGCNFKNSRILEDDNVSVFTTAMTEYEFVFGGRNKLIKLLNRLKENFSFRRVGVVGTCASMIIGEDLEEIKREKKSDMVMEILTVGVHCGFGDNTMGAILAMKAAADAGIISKEEVNRQEKILRKATEIEKKRGMVSMEYIKPSKGDNKMHVAKEIVDFAKARKKMACVLIGKKELSYIFSDIVLEINKIVKKYGAEVINLANLDPSLGLPRVRKYSRNIMSEFAENGVSIDYIVGGIDDYAFSGERAARIMEKIKDKDIDIVVVIGNPHAVEMSGGAVKKIAVTNGPREVIPLKKMGYDRVIVELEAHPKVIGTYCIIPSDFGDAMRYICSSSYSSYESGMKL